MSHLLLRRLAVAVALGVIVGCDGGPRYVPVSGVVSLNGKPYPEAVISFQPIATEANQNPGRGSSAYTDAAGKFQLKTDDGNEGAVPGKHRVRVMTKGNDMVLFDPEKGSPDSLPPGTKNKIDPIPRAWNIDSDKEFEVPAKGTDRADFDIVTKQ